MQNLNQKQDYLSKQILDQGHDPEQFQDFMMHNSNKELDLNLWTLAQLKAVVTKFKNKNRNHSEEQRESKQIQLEANSKQHTDKQQSNKKQQQLSSKQPSHQHQQQQEIDNKSMMASSVNSSLYKYFAFKQKTNLPQLYTTVHIDKKNVEVKIKSYNKTIPNNIFKSSYIQYQIQCTLGWNVKRRFTDFVWLQEYLKKKYEGLPIPPIPSKTTLRSFDQKHIEYRMLMFGRFLNTLIQMPEICSDHVLETFLRANYQVFSQSKKKLQEKLEQDQGTNVVESVWGNDMVLMDKHGVESATINFYRQYTAKLTSLSSQLNLMIDGIKKAASESFQASSCFQQMQQLLETLPGSNITGILYQFCNGLGMHLNKTVDFIKQSLYSVWNYETMYIQNLTANLAKIQKQKSHMNQKYKNAMMKVTDEGSSAFVSSMEPNKMIKEFQMVKQQYRIKLSYMLRQMQRYENQEMILVSKEWAKNLRVSIHGISDWMIGCTDILTKTMSVCEGKKLVEVQYVNK